MVDTSFIIRLEKAYPDYPRLIELVKANSRHADNYFDGSYGVVSDNDILSATSLEELQDKVRLIKTRKKLHEEWRNLFKAE